MRHGSAVQSLLTVAGEAVQQVCVIFRTAYRGHWHQLHPRSTCRASDAVHDIPGLPGITTSCALAPGGANLHYQLLIWLQVFSCSVQGREADSLCRSPQTYVSALWPLTQIIRRATNPTIDLSVSPCLATAAAFLALLYVTCCCSDPSESRPGLYERVL